MLLDIRKDSVWRKAIIPNPYLYLGGKLLKYYLLKSVKIPLMFFISDNGTP